MRDFVWTRVDRNGPDRLVRAGTLSTADTQQEETVMIRKAFVLIGALALVVASAVPAQARPAPPTPERKPRCSVPVEIPGKTKVRTCPDGQLAVYSWDSRAGWVLVYARLGDR